MVTTSLDISHAQGTEELRRHAGLEVAGESLLQYGGYPGATIQFLD
jgi:hypothetical protein